MKLCMIVSNSVWYDPRVSKMAKAASETGIDTTVVGLRDARYDAAKIRNLPFEVDLFCVDQKYYRANRTILTKAVRTILIHYQLIKRCLRAKPDVIHANDLDTLIVGYLSSRLTKCALVYDCHEIFVENSGVVEKKKVRLFWKVIERLLITRADRVLSVSHSSAGQLAKMYPITLPTVITNSACSLPQNMCREKNSCNFEVLYHGQFYSNRGYEAFVRAAANIDNHKIQFVLRGYGAIENELRELAAGLHLENKLRFDPPVDVTELVRAASSAHVGVVIAEPVNINFINTVSNKLFEYISAGLPVIMSNSPEHIRLNDMYNFGIILADNEPSTIWAAVCRLYTDNVLYEKLKANSLKASNELNWECEFERLREIYRSSLRKGDQLGINR